MEPTLVDGEYVITFSPRGLLSQLFDMRRILRRGMIVVFRAPNTEQEKAPPLFVKRIVAISRDRIRIEKGILIRNGTAVAEPYARYPLEAARQHDDWPMTAGVIEILEQQLFVMGDNRLGSTDSRSFGPLPESRVVGIVVCTIPQFSHVHAK
jgi:signal peptidase I